MMNITFYHHRSNKKFCTVVAERLSFTGIEILLSENKVDLGTDLLFIFCVDNIDLSDSALSFIESRKQEKPNTIIPVIFEESYCPDILNIFKKIKTVHGANIETARKIIKYIVYHILHKRTEDLQFITVKIHNLQDDTFLGNGTIVSQYGDIVTSGEVLRKTYKPLSSLSKTKFGIVVPHTTLFSQKVLLASISNVYEDIAPFEVVLLKIEDNTIFKDNYTYAPLMPYQPNFDLTFRSYAWSSYSNSEIQGDIRDTNKNNEHYVKKFIAARSDSGISNIYCGSPIRSEDNRCVIGVIILVQPLPGYETNQAVCCTSNLIKNEFGIDTIFNSPIINHVVPKEIEIKSQNPERTSRDDINISKTKYNAFEKENGSTVIIKKDERLKKPTVFLCHAKEDIKKVRNLYNKLYKDGINVWLDEKNIKPGEVWESSIEKAIEESSIVIICLSNKSIAKEGYVNKEIKSCLNKADKMPEGKQFLIPLRFEMCNVPSSLKKFQYIDYPKDYHKLIEVLKEYLLT